VKTPGFRSFAVVLLFVVTGTGGLLIIGSIDGSGAAAVVES
jgi:hypothetical protein